MQLLPLWGLSILLPSFGVGQKNAIGSDTKLRISRQTSEQFEVEDLPVSLTNTKRFGQEQDNAEDPFSNLPASMASILQSLQVQLEDIRDKSIKLAAAVKQGHQQDETRFEKLKRDVAGIQQQQAEQFAMIRQEQTNQTAEIKKQLKQIAANQEELKQKAAAVVQDVKQQATGIQQQQAGLLEAIQREQTKSIAEAKEDLKRVAANQLKQTAKVDTMLQELKQQVTSIQEERAQQVADAKEQKQRVAIQPSKMDQVDNYIEELKRQVSCLQHQQFAATLKQRNLNWYGYHGSSGGTWFSDCDTRVIDDGPITEIHIGYGSWIEAIRVTYGCKRAQQHGNFGLTQQTLILDEGEHITIVNGTYSNYVNSLLFTTNRGRQLGPFGETGSSSFSVQAPAGHMLRCIAGKASAYRLKSFYFVWIPTN